MLPPPRADVRCTRCAAGIIAGGGAASGTLLGAGSVGMPAAESQGLLASTSHLPTQGFLSAAAPAGGVAEAAEAPGIPVPGYAVSLASLAGGGGPSLGAGLVRH